jgi:hypothetical protein
LDWWYYLGKYEIEKRSKRSCRRQVVFKKYTFQKNSFNFIERVFLWDLVSALGIVAFVWALFSFSEKKRVRKARLNAQIIIRQTLLRHHRNYHLFGVPSFSFG